MEERLAAKRNVTAEAEVEVKLSLLIGILIAMIEPRSETQHRIQMQMKTSKKMTLILKMQTMMEKRKLTMMTKWQQEKMNEE